MPITKKCYSTFLVFLALLIPTKIFAIERMDNLKIPDLFITLDAFAGTGHAALSINSYKKNMGNHDYMALSSYKPRHASDYIPHAWIWARHLPKDTKRYLTQTQLSGSNGIIDPTQLTGYYVMYAKWLAPSHGYTIADAQPYRLHSSWMEEDALLIRDFPLSDIVIPGTHNSGVYNPVSQVFAPFVKNQNMDFTGQLETGIRYFDLRFKAIPSNTTDHFWTHHDGWNTYTNLNHLTTQVLNFLNRNKKEIVILDFSHFNSFTPDLLREFQARVEREFGSLMATREQATDPIGTLQATGKRVVALTDKMSMIGSSTNSLWSSSINIYHTWCNKSTVSELKKCLDDRVKYTIKNGLWLLQGILSQDASTASIGTEMQASTVNPFLGQWLANEWQQQVNVIFSDFSLGNNLVDVARAINTYHDQ